MDSSADVLLSLFEDLARVGVDQNIFARSLDGLVEVSLAVELGVGRHFEMLIYWI